MNQTSTRYALLDELRGLDLISMMLYHGTWDAVYLFGVAVRGMRARRGVCGSRASAGDSFCCPVSVCPWGITPSSAAQWSSGPGRWSQP